MAGFFTTPPYFTNRVSELATLAQVADDLLAGRPHHTALFGLRRIGKTLLCQEQMRRLRAGDQVIPIYLDLEDLASSPELFAQRYVGLSCFWAIEHGAGPADAYLNAIDLLQTSAGSLPVVTRAAAALLNELGKQKTDYSTLLTIAFEFPEQLADTVGKPCIIFLDEFPELATLGSFPGIGDPLKHFRATLQKHTRVAYVITGSAVSAIEHIVRDHESSLFLQFRALELRPFTPEDTQALVEKLAGWMSPAAHAAIHTYTFGHPFYITALADRVRQLAAGDSDAITADLVSQAFVLETLENRGQIYGYCRYLYDISLQKARGYGALKALLQILAIEDGLTLSEIAARMRRQAPATREYLRRLMEVDLLIEREGRYVYADPVFRYWVAQTTKGVAIESFPRQDDLKSLVAGLSERFARASTQLGRAKESEVRELLRKLAGLTMPGRHFGQTASIQVPAFSRVEPYRSPDGQTEIDALAENGEMWVVEVKWRQKRVGQSELAQMLVVSTSLSLGAESHPARAWCISQAGFTPDALVFAREHGILTSDASDLVALEKLPRQVSAM
jgi:AAA+ ATPase superfamily predicted ATPase